MNADGGKFIERGIAKFWFGSNSITPVCLTSPTKMPLISTTMLVVTISHPTSFGLKKCAFDKISTASLFNLTILDSPILINSGSFDT